MADTRSDLQGNPQDFEPESGTAKLERKKPPLPKPEGQSSEHDPDNVQTAELRERMKLSLGKRDDAGSTAADLNPPDDATTELAPPTDKPGTERVVKKTSLRLSQSGTNKLTESRRMLRPTGARQPTDSKKMLRPKSLAGMSDSSRLQRPRSVSQMSEEEKIQTQELLPHEMDPSRRRETDTANLKRIRPGKTSAEGITAGGETGTDTIHLRVIKEKKNQLKNILSASQTIRLRPSPSDTPSARNEQAPDAAAPATQVQESESGTGTEPTQKRTLKIKAPTQGQPAPDRPKTGPIPVPETKEDPHTAMVNRNQLAETQVPTALKRRAPSLQPRTDAEVKTDTVKLKAPVRPPTSDGDGGKATLKIKAPPTAAPQPTVPSTETRQVPGADDRKSTLKIKAPSSPGGLTQRSVTPGAQTVKQEAPAPGGGKTLKLKAAPKSLQAPAAPATNAPAPREEAAPAREEAAPAPISMADEPGIFYTLGAVASFLVIAVSVALGGYSFFQLYMG